MPTSSFQENHSKIWHGIIFQDRTWTSIATSRGLNPALVGRGVPVLYHSGDGLETPQAHLVLVTGDQSRSIYIHSKIFLDSLRPHTLYKSTNEVVFKNSNITLNIHDVLESPEIIHMEPEQLFSSLENRLCSTYIFLKDDQYALRILEAACIVGIGGKAFILKDVSVICGLVLKPPKASGLHKSQQIFCVKGLRGRHVQQIGKIGHVYSGNKCRGWNWATKSKSRPLSQIKEEV
jgi:hypothetical protein